MNKKIITGLLLTFVAVAVYAHNLAGINADGDSLWFNNVSSATGRRNVVELTYKGSWWGAVENEYQDTINIPETITINRVTYTVIGIGEQAFAECRKLHSVTIPETIEYIGNGAFESCCYLKQINYNAIRCADFTLPSFAPFSFNNMAVGEYVYDEDGYPDNYWSAYDLEEVNVGEKVERIPDYMFYGLGGTLQQADFTRSPYVIVTTKAGVPHINFLGQPKEFGNQAFRACRMLKDITLPDGVTFIGQALFADCDTLQTIVLPDGIEEIPAYFFMNCKELANINIPNSVKSINYEAFKGCTKLTEVVLPEGLTVVGPSAFRSCENLSSAVLPSTLKTIDGYAFSDCTTLQSIVIPQSVNEIGNYAFEDCTHLKTIKLEGSTRLIGNFVFAGCINLSKGEVNAPAKMPQIKANTFFGVENSMKVNVPKESEDEYRNDPYWGRFFMPTSVSNVTTEAAVKSNKYMLNGQIVIENNGTTYTVDGRQIFGN